MENFKADEKLKGTKTYQNLQTAFAGESMARNKYTFYASQAKKDGSSYVADIFEKTANNEKAHGKIWFKLLHGGSIPATIENLIDAQEGEEYEWKQMYPTFAKEAREEGFEDIAKLFEGVATVENHHYRRYTCAKDLAEADYIFKSAEKVIWECGNCGFGYEGTEPPAVCPVCGHPITYFSIRKERCGD